MPTISRSWRKSVGWRWWSDIFVSETPLVWTRLVNKQISARQSKNLLIVLVSFGSQCWNQAKFQDCGFEAPENWSTNSIGDNCLADLQK
jgi:hypothetical protein